MHQKNLKTISCFSPIFAFQHLTFIQIQIGATVLLKCVNFQLDQSEKKAERLHSGVAGQCTCTAPDSQVHLPSSLILWAYLHPILVTLSLSADHLDLLCMCLVHYCRQLQAKKLTVCKAQLAVICVLIGCETKFFSHF